MSYSYTRTTTETFNLTHARRLAAKVTADLHQCQLFYGKPSDAAITNYQEELTALLHGRYVETYEFGFKTRADKRIVSWLYTVGPSGDLEGGRSGGLYAIADVSNAVWFNFLSYSSAWFALTGAEKDSVKAQYSIRRSDGTAPVDGDGYWDTSRPYVSGGVAVIRKEFRPW